MADTEENNDPLITNKNDNEPNDKNAELKSDGENNSRTSSNQTSQSRLSGKPNLLQWLEITVTEPEKRTGPSMKVQETYTVYMIETRVTDPNVKGYTDDTTTVWRRYSEFELLRNYLDISYPAVIVPPLPEKKGGVTEKLASYVWQKSATDKFDPDFIERRRSGLEIFLLRIAAHSVLCSEQIFMSFIKRDNGWRDMLEATDYQNKADSRLKALSAAFRLKKPDRRYEELKNYSNELQNNIANILRTRSKLCDKLYGIHKVHANYARVYVEWSGSEKEMADHLQSAAHYMDVYANSIDPMLDEEEQYADQLKEYLGFSESIRAVCRKQECLQYDQERLEDSLSYKASQKDAVLQGKNGGFSLSGMKSKIFGSDTSEQREQKLKQLDEQIAQNETELRATNAEMQKFIDQSLRDVERFKRQKVKDLREIFTNYAIMQIKQCKKGIAIWTSAKDCFAKI